MTRRHRLVLLALVLAIPTAVCWLAPRWSRAEASTARAPDRQAGALLFQQDCAICHGPAGKGSFRGPDISGSGTAAVDFMLTTGRMPIERPRTDVSRRPPRYDRAQIDDILAYTREFISGPEVPHPDLATADEAQGGQLYRFNCASCHQAVGAGGALAYGVVAPSLRRATPTQAVEAMRTGPGTMPVFDEKTFDDKQAADLAKYVKYLHEPSDRGGLALWHIGPVAEGMVALVVGLGAVVIIIRWLGTRDRIETQ